VTQSSHPGDALTRGQRFVYILVLGGLVALGPFTIDLYLPAFPGLQDDFGVSEGRIQLTLTATILGFALGQLIVGPWSDKVGRRLPLILTTVVHITASFAAIASPDVNWLSLCRVLQGMGAAGGAVVAMAVVRDLFGGRPLVVMLSRLSLVTNLAPIVAPVLGSQLLLFTDWRGMFLFLAIYGTVAGLFVTFFLVETMNTGQRNPRHATARERYRAIFTDRIFLGVALIGAMRFAGLFSYLASSPFLFQEVYGFSAQQFGLLFAVNSVGLFLGVQGSARLTRVLGPQWILVITTSVQVVAALAIIAGAQLGLWWVLVPLFVFIFACGLGLPMVQVLALINHGREAGTAASLLGAVNFGLAGLISPIVGFLGVGRGAPMGAVMAATAAVGVLAVWVIVRPHTVPPLTD
jgi:DHA1 family bicyclomycin/chloramphenicol resistance-like MFS transporter